MSSLVPFGAVKMGERRSRVLGCRNIAVALADLRANCYCFGATTVTFAEIILYLAQSDLHSPAEWERAQHTLIFLAGALGPSR